MDTIPFSKFHGFGNDYIVILRSDIPDRLELPALAIDICHRNTGAGADGIAVLNKLDGEESDYFCEIVNPDGSIAGFSGNGTRCAVSYLYFNKLWTAENLRLTTRSGTKNYHLVENPESGTYIFEAEIGKPKFASGDVPVATDDPVETVIDHPIIINGENFAFSAVNVGNPVACIFVEDFDFDWRAVGQAMETHDLFPDRANIVFVKILDRENIELRIWERGAGETSASGTCSVGSAVLSALTEKTGRKVQVHSPGGITNVDWLRDDEMVLTGRADFIYNGQWPY